MFLVAGIGLAGQDHAHQGRVVVAVSPRELEGNLVVVRDLAVTGVVADQERLLATAHGPAPARNVAAAPQHGVQHLTVNGTDRRARHRRFVGDRERPVGERAGTTHVFELGRAFYQPHEANQVGGIDEIAETAQRRIDQPAPLPGESIGMVLDAKALAPAAMAFQHVAHVLGRVGRLAVVPDTHVLDDRRRPRLAPVGGAGDQRQGAVGAEVHGLEHREARGVVAGQVIHALLSENQQSVEPRVRHLVAGTSLSMIEFLAREVQCHEKVPSISAFSAKRGGRRRNRLGPGLSLSTLPLAS